MKIYVLTSYETGEPYVVEEIIRAYAHRSEADEEFQRLSDLRTQKVEYNRLGSERCQVYRKEAEFDRTYQTFGRIHDACEYWDHVACPALLAERLRYGREVDPTMADLVDQTVGYFRSEDLRGFNVHEVELVGGVVLKIVLSFKDPDGVYDSLEDIVREELGIGRAQEDVRVTLVRQDVLEVAHEEPVPPGTDPPLASPGDVPAVVEPDAVDHPLGGYLLHRHRRSPAPQPHHVSRLKLSIRRQSPVVLCISRFVHLPSLLVISPPTTCSRPGRPPSPST